MNERKFEVGGHYLIKDSNFYSCHIYEIEIIEMSMMCYKIKHILSDTITWEYARDFDEKVLIERLDIILQNEILCHNGK